MGYTKRPDTTSGIPPTVLESKEWLGYAFTPGTLPDGSNLYDRIQQQYADVAIVKEALVLTHDEIELLKEMVHRAEDTIGWFCDSPTCPASDCQDRREDAAEVQRAKELLERLENAE